MSPRLGCWLARIIFALGIAAIGFGAVYGSLFVRRLSSKSPGHEKPNGKAFVELTPPGRVAEQPVDAQASRTAARDAGITPVAQTRARWPNVQPSELPDALQAAFNAETTDSRWTHKTEMTIASGLRRLDPHLGTVESVACKETLCRIDVTFSNVNTRGEFMKKALVGSGAPLASLNMPFIAPGRPYGAQNYTIYLRRNDVHPTTTINERTIQ